VLLVSQSFSSRRSEGRTFSETIYQGLHRENKNSNYGRCMRGHAAVLLVILVSFLMFCCSMVTRRYTLLLDMVMQESRVYCSVQSVPSVKQTRSVIALQSLHASAGDLLSDVAVVLLKEGSCVFVSICLRTVLCDTHPVSCPVPFRECPPCLLILCSMIGSFQTNVEWRNIRFNCPEPSSTRLALSAVPVPWHRCHTHCT